MQVTWRGHRGRGEVDLRQPPCGLHIVLTLVEGAFGAAALQDVLDLFCRSVEFLGSHHTCHCHPQLLIEDRLLLLLAQPLEVHGHHANVGKHSEVAVVTVCIAIAAHRFRIIEDLRVEVCLRALVADRVNTVRNNRVHFSREKTWAQCGAGRRPRSPPCAAAPQTPWRPIGQAPP